MQDEDSLIERRNRITKGKRLLIVTNREPYVHKKADDGEIECSVPNGGVTAALDPVMQEVGGTWIAWGSGDADRDKVDGNDRVQVPPARPRYSLRRVWLTKSEVDDYYLGYCNQGLWPLSHGLISNVSFEKRKWKKYRRVNRKFADAVSAEIIDGDEIVWVHDYHLTLLPGMLRERHPDITIALFWHIPWPQSDTLRICPQYKQILRGLADCDLVGFHIKRYRDNFLECLNRAWPDEKKTSFRFPQAGVFPISIDFEDIQRVASLPKVDDIIQRYRSKYNLDGKTVSSGVDRMDYTKGIPNRLEAIEMVLDNHPEYRGAYTHLQVCSPSRTGIDEYRAVKKEVVDITKRVNNKYATEDWTPLVVFHKMVPFEDIVSLYRMADFGIVSPLADGMNLVAKEFIAAQIDTRGILLISEFAGVAGELKNVLKFNPFEIDSFAQCIKNALDMPAEEKSEMSARAREATRGYTIFDWVRRFINATAEIAADQKTARQKEFLETDSGTPHRVELDLDTGAAGK